MSRTRISAKSPNRSRSRQGVTLEAICGLVRQAGFAGVVTSDMADVERVERELHGEPGDDEPPRYVLTAAKP